MALSYNVKANAVTSNIANGEGVIGSTLLIPANSIAVGDAIRITVEAFFPGTVAYNFNVRVGANGNQTDAALFSANNLVSPLTLFTDANTWAQTNPGLPHNQYQLYAPYNAAAFSSVSQTPAKIEGTIMAVCVSQNVASSNAANLAFIIQPDVANSDVGNLLESLRVNSNERVLGYGTFVSNTNMTVSLTANVGPLQTLSYVGEGQGNTSTPGASMNIVSLNGNTNGTFVFSIVEAL